MASLTYMQLLRGNRSFRRLLLGQVVSELGNWFNFIAGLGLVRSVSGAAPEATALMVVVRFAPFAVFAPIAGAFVDRWSRRTVMIASDCARAFVTLGFLFVSTADDLWIAYTCTAISGLLMAFFEGAKNAAMPNLTGDRGLLAGNALLFSSRFLLMSVGAALGGAASARFGYHVAFIIDALSYIVSAYAIWLIPEGDLKAKDDGRAETVEAVGERSGRGRGRVRVFQDIQEGWKYIARHPLLLAIIGINILWATGGGAGNLIYDRLGGVVFAGQGGLQPDAGVAVLYTAVGVGLFLGMMLARRVGAHVELRKLTVGFIGWMLIAHGILFALAGLMPNLWSAALMMCLSRFIIALEFALQETLMMRALPDHLRGRVFTTDRAAEISVMSGSTFIAGWALHAITPRSLTIISGLLSASPGIVWLALFALGKLRLPPSPENTQETKDAEKVMLASAG
ncbi:MAG: MFS transporter [Pyrinomonadaceae bacterium]